MKKRLLGEFISISRKDKLSLLYQTTYVDIKCIENFSEDDDTSTHLYKCIDVYVEDNLYHGTIRGFFRYLPSGVPFSEWNKWKDISQEWEKLYRDTEYVKD